jgi:hypothetical protein
LEAPTHGIPVAHFSPRFLWHHLGGWRHQRRTLHPSRSLGRWPCWWCGDGRSGTTEVPDPDDGLGDHHGAILANINSGIRSPKDLEGKRVGVNRGYTVTTGVWARGILQDEHGVDLSKITWVLSGDEHVAEYRPPSNVVPIEKGKKMADMIASGELVAAIGVEIEHPDVKPLIPNAKEAGFEALRGRGHYPINHTVVVKDDLLAAHPDLASDVFNAFAEAKRLYVERLKSGRIEKPTADRSTLRRCSSICRTMNRQKNTSAARKPTAAASAAGRSTAPLSRSAGARRRLKLLSRLRQCRRAKRNSALLLQQGSQMFAKPALEHGNSLVFHERHSTKTWCQWPDNPRSHGDSVRTFAMNPHDRKKIRTYRKDVQRHHPAGQ